jgi:hypothetical protein
MLSGVDGPIMTTGEGAQGLQWSFLDPASGGVLWSSSGWVEPIGAGTAVLVTRHLRPDGNDRWLREVAVVDAATGTSGWEVQLDDDRQASTIARRAGDRLARGR